MRHEGLAKAVGDHDAVAIMEHHREKSRRMKVEDGKVVTAATTITTNH